MIAALGRGLATLARLAVVVLLVWLLGRFGVHTALQFAVAGGVVAASWMLAVVVRAARRDGWRTCPG